MRADFEAYVHDTYDDKPFGPDELLGMEDEAGMDVVITMPQAGPAPDNDRLAELIKGRSRMIGCAWVNPCLGGAVEELEKCVKDHGFKGLKLMPTMHKFVLDSDLVNPLIEKARELNIVVTLHTGSEHCSPLQAANLAEKFPEVTFILDHMGYRYQTDQAIQAAERCENICLGATLVAAAEPIIVKKAVQQVGAYRVVFGSNAPGGIPYLGVEGIKRVNLGKDAEKLVLGENLKRIYNL